MTPVNPRSMLNFIIGQALSLVRLIKKWIRVILKYEDLVEHCRKIETHKISRISLGIQNKIRVIRQFAISGAARISVQGWEDFRGRPRRRSEGLCPPPPDAGGFSKIFKKFLKKIANNALF